MYTLFETEQESLGHSYDPNKKQAINRRKRPKSSKPNYPPHSLPIGVQHFDKKIPY